MEFKFAVLAVVQVDRATEGTLHSIARRMRLHDYCMTWSVLVCLEIGDRVVATARFTEHQDSRHREIFHAGLGRDLTS